MFYPVLWCEFYPPGFAWRCESLFSFGSMEEGFDGV